jgi:hypothetical protein
MGQSRFEYGFKIAEKIESEIVKIGFRGLIETAEADFNSSPLTGTFSYSCKYVMFTFVFAILSL